MDTDNSRLPAIALAQLFRHSLVEIADGGTSELPTPNPANAGFSSEITDAPATKAAIGELTAETAATGKGVPAEATTDTLPANATAGAPAAISAKPPQGESTSSESPSAPLRFLGNNAKQIVILVHYPAEPFLPETALQFLTNILSACKLNIGDTAIVNTVHHVPDLSQLRSELNVQQLILFGSIPGNIRNTAQFTIEQINGVTTLSAPALENLNNNSPDSKQLKSRLWQCLKQLFQV